jgi:hypothetical protein
MKEIPYHFSLAPFWQQSRYYGGIHMRQLLSGVAFTLFAAATMAAQSGEVKRETQIEVKDGKDVTVTGCVERHADPTGATSFQLTDVADKHGRRGAYLLIGEGDDLEDHVGHMVEIKGKAADSDDGRIKVKSKTKVERDDADDTKTETTEEVKGDLRGVPLLDVDKVRMIRPTCE